MVNRRRTTKYNRRKSLRGSLRRSLKRKNSKRKSRKIVRKNKKRTRKIKQRGGTDSYGSLDDDLINSKELRRQYPGFRLAHDFNQTGFSRGGCGAEEGQMIGKLLVLYNIGAVFREISYDSTYKCQVYWDNRDDMGIQRIHVEYTKQDSSILHKSFDVPINCSVAVVEELNVYLEDGERVKRDVCVLRILHADAGTVDKIQILFDSTSTMNDFITRINSLGDTYNFPYTGMKLKTDNHLDGAVNISKGGNLEINTGPGDKTLAFTEEEKIFFRDIEDFDWVNHQVTGMLGGSYGTGLRIKLKKSIKLSFFSGNSGEFIDIKFKFTRNNEFLELFMMHKVKPLIDEENTEPQVKAEVTANPAGK